MAKIFRTEELQIDGKNIQLSASTDGNLVFKDSSDAVVTSTDIIAADISSLTFKDLDLDSDVSSLQFKDTDLDSDVSSLQFKNKDIDSDVSSLQFKDTDLDSDVSSLQAQRDVDEAANDNEISSLTFKDLDLDADVSSLAFGISQNDTYAAEQTMSSGVDSVTHTIAVGTRSFSSQPRITATLVGGASDPIIGVMITGINWTDASSDTTVNFVFSDDLPSANYKLQVFAAV